MDSAGLARERTDMTNAVKHFKWKPRGKRRIHDKPNRTEVVACHRWLAAELDVVDPTVVVALGATAGQSLFGPSFRVGVSGSEARRVGKGCVGTSRSRWSRVH